MLDNVIDKIRTHNLKGFSTYAKTTSFRHMKLHVKSQIVMFLVLSYVYSKQPILGLTQEWFRELSFSRLECGVHKLHISSADWWDLLLPLA